MQKRRVFKGTKPKAATKKPEKKVEKKATPVKKVVEKRPSPVKKAKPAEQVKKPVVEKDHKPTIEFKPHVHKHTKPETETVMPKETMIESNSSEDQTKTDDVIVVEETTVTQVVTNTDGPSRKFSFVWTLLGIFLVFLAGGLAFAFLFQQPQQPEQVYTAPTETPAPTQPQAPAPSAWNVEILNGSGIPGAAGRMANQLKTLGYTQVTTANADATQEETTIYLSKEFMPFAETFTENLKSLNISAKNGGELTESSVSARIIIGTN